MKPQFSEDGHIINKDAVIKDEIRKLNAQFADIPEKQKAVAESVIRSDSFQTVNMLELESILNIKGFVEGYQNGANQYGLKESSEARSYINLAKTHLAYRKHLNNLLPKGSTPVDDGFDDFIGGREN